MDNNIRRLRTGHGVTQKELAKHLGVAQNTLSYWEQGKYDIDNASLQKIADYFKCSIDFVLCRENVTSNTSSKNNDSFSKLITDHEKALILAYRNRKEMQGAVDTLLGIKSDCEIAEDMCDVFKMTDKIRQPTKQK